MATSSAKLLIRYLCIIIIVISFSLTPAHAKPCNSSTGGREGCRDSAKSLELKIIAIISILATSMIGVCLPLLSHSMPALRPDKDLFVVVKAFASGVILATGYMHVLPDSFKCLQSECLPENPWRKFPFTAFVAMLSSIFTLMVDSFATSYYKKYGFHGDDQDEIDKNSMLLRYRVVAQVLELGIVVHSVVIGLSMGASDNSCMIRPLILAFCFHQLFEGMGLGGCISQAEYKNKMKVILVFFFSTTTPLGIILGIGLSKSYSENSPTSLIVIGLLNATSAGLLNYMALVDLLAADFMSPKLQDSVRLQIWAYLALLVGVGCMSLMSKWA